MSLLGAIPVWGYFIVLGLAFITGHLLAFHPDPAMSRGRRMAGRWGSSLLLLVGLLMVSNRNGATVLPSIVMALLGGVVSGRAAPVSPGRDGAPSEQGRSPVGSPADGAGTEAAPPLPTPAEDGPGDTGDTR